ncbi:GMC family oxidoreductase N-terminal domain-containing protein [Thermodesulfobacteriota bacterium]
MPDFLLSPREKDIICAIGQTIIPPGRIFPPFHRDVLCRVEKGLNGSSAALRHSFRSILWMLEKGAYTRYLRPLSALSEKRRLAYLKGWAEGPWLGRSAFRIFSTVLKVHYYNDPGLCEKLGVEYRKPPVQDQPEPWHRLVTQGNQIDEDTELEADVVVVGSGAGGAVAACELAEKGNAVVLVEEGDFHRRSAFTGRPFEMQRLMYRNQGLTFTAGNTGIMLPVGRCVGGTTTINSGTCLRPPRSTLRTWRDAYGLTDFTPKAMAPYFERVEAVYEVTPADMKYVGKNGEIIARGAGRLGYNHGPIPRCSPDCDGQGVCCYGCPSDAKRSTNVSYVPRALKSNAHLLTGTRVERLLLEDGRAVGVRGRSTRTNRYVTVRASVVVLACGTLFTPLLLMKHNIGNRSGWLGKNISIHPGTSMGALMGEQVEGWKSIPQGYMVDEFAEEGILFEGGQVPIDMTAMVFGGIGKELQDFMENYDRLATFGLMIEDSSRGRVIRGSGGFPLITYYLNGSDLKQIIRGVSILSRIYLAAGAQKVWPQIFGWKPITGKRDLEENLARKVRARDIDISAFHPLGSCHMGGDREKYVCDPHGELYDVKNLFICDGSVVPPALGVNPMITISALATRTADYIAERLSMISQS